MGIDQCKLIELPAVGDAYGDLVYAEGEHHIPFPIARAFFVHSVPAEAARGGHAHRELEEVVFCLHGRLQVTVDDGIASGRFLLDDPRVGLYLPPMVWYDIDGFAPGTVYLAFASAAFDEADYIRDRAAFDDTVAAAA